MEYGEFFTLATGLPAAFDYQTRLATEAWPDVVDVATGMGKTAAVTLAVSEIRARSGAASLKRFKVNPVKRVIVQIRARSSSVPAGRPWRCSNELHIRS